MIRYFPFEFHISRVARDRYQFDQSLFSSNGNVVLANFHAARLFAHKMNSKRDLIRFPEQAIKAGQINAMGLIDEILHIVILLYQKQVNPSVMEQALTWLTNTIGEKAVITCLQQFTESFPPLAVYQRLTSVTDYLEGTTLVQPGLSISNHRIALEEMLLLWLANVNPAFAQFDELFADDELAKRSGYNEIISALRSFFAAQTPFGPDHENLIDMLRSPAIAEPYSLAGQLEYIRLHWGFMLGEHITRLLTSQDLLQEEIKELFLGPGPSLIYDFKGQGLEESHFSPDLAWMPSLVLIAKNIYVWLDQLSRQYGRKLSRLDDIPDEALEQLANWGFTGIWLIGIWERSPASKRIKILRGNLDAIASAYSLYDYKITSALGGDEAFFSFRQRAWHHGIRVGADMVPNHMGIDSPWVIQHPEWFVSVSENPFPAYSFSGPDLSGDERVGIFLEDHYYDSTDAAVVFKRLDRWTGSVTYIYHGNDGTSMPWNDTAQLNYLLSQVREAVIQTILSVAHKFSIIRFDAAMTLTRKHYQRLWFPEPGSGGDIPSRAGLGLTKTQFEAVFPQEFWRQVVERVAKEAPDTLLLAEAFWLMEGYFVRTLGMHRVYNSAFMNMLRDEKNKEYRQLIKNTLEFDPQILKRYVSFMNNPDERTAVDQFGKGDKYFGICTLMCTLPGLPMFGHGQIEGFSEKYGMEFQRAYWDEIPDRDLVEKHERRIFPLLRQRYLFADVENFQLYDFYEAGDVVDEDVFAFSNGSGTERSLVIYHNRYEEARGWIKNASKTTRFTGGKGEKSSQGNNTLAAGLGLPDDSNCYVIFRDHNTQLEYIRNCHAIYDQGLYFEMRAYQCHVFLDFRLVYDDEWHKYSHLAAFLNGRGVASIENALKETFLQPIHAAFCQLVNENMFNALLQSSLAEGQSDESENLLGEVEKKAYQLLREINNYTHASLETDPLARIAQGIRHETEIIMKLATFVTEDSVSRLRNFRAARHMLQQFLGLSNQSTTRQPVDPTPWWVLYTWVITHSLGKVKSAHQVAEYSRSWLDQWLLVRIITNTLRSLGTDENTSPQAALVVKLLISHQSWFNPGVSIQKNAYQALHTWLGDEILQQYIGYNRYQWVLWYNQEAFEGWLKWMLLMATIEQLTDKSLNVEDIERAIGNAYAVINRLQRASQASGFRVEMLLDAVKS